jgi:hypothetical protein
MRVTELQGPRRIPHHESTGENPSKGGDLVGEPLKALGLSLRKQLRFGADLVHHAPIVG